MPFLRTAGCEQMTESGQYSFLQSLSGELRNMVYEILFKRPKLVLLHNANAYHAEKPLRFHFRTDDAFREARNRFHKTFAEEVGADEEFRHGLGEAIAFLQTCRQVHREAASVLYSQNSFLFTRVLTCGHTDHEDDEHDAEAYHQFNYAACWLSDIGSNFRLLTKAYIDIDALCPSTTEFDALPLLRLLWRQIDGNCPIEFAATGRKMSSTCPCEGYDSEEEQEQATSHASREAEIVRTLNEQLVLIGMKDALAIKQYAYSRRLLKKVTISTYGCSRVIYKHMTTPHVFRLVSKDHKPFLVRSKKLRRVGLVDLPRELLGKIFRWVQQRDSACTINLATRQLEGFPLAALHITKALRNDDSVMLGALGSDRVVTLKSCVAATTADPTKLASIGEIRNLADLDVLLQYSSGIADTLSRILIHAYFNVRLDITCCYPSSPLHFSADVTGLLLLFRRHSLSPRAQLSITFTSPRAKELFQETTTVSLLQVARIMFLLLVDLEEKDPLAAKQAPQDLRIWMNGHAQLLRADLVTADGRTFTASNTYNALKGNEVFEQGYRSANVLRGDRKMTRDERKLGARHLGGLHVDSLEAICWDLCPDYSAYWIDE